MNPIFYIVVITAILITTSAITVFGQNATEIAGDKMYASIEAANAGFPTAPYEILHYDEATNQVFEIPPEGRYCLDLNGDKVCDVEFLDGEVIEFERKQIEVDSSNNKNNDNNNNDNDIKYCDGQSAPQYPDSCYDRNDLPEDSGFDDDDKLPNCNDVEYGTHCNGTEDENSWTDGEEPNN